MYQLKYEDKLIAEFEEKPTNEEILKLFTSIIKDHLNACGSVIGLKDGTTRQAVIEQEESQFLLYLMNEIEDIQNKMLEL